MQGGPNPNPNANPNLVYDPNTGRYVDPRAGAVGHDPRAYENYPPAEGAPRYDARGDRIVDERDAPNQLSHPVGGGSFAQALAAVKGGATVMLSMNNRPAVKLGPVEAGATDWMIVDPVTNQPVPLVTPTERETGIEEVDRDRTRP